MCGRRTFGWGWLILTCLCLSFARDEERRESKASSKKVTFNLSGDEDSEGEDIEDIFGGKSQISAKSELKSSFEKRQEKVTRLNDAAVLSFTLNVDHKCINVAVQGFFWTFLRVVPKTYEKYHNTKTILLISRVEEYEKNVFLNMKPSYKNSN